MIKPKDVIKNRKRSLRKLHPIKKVLAVSFLICVIGYPIKMFVTRIQEGKVMRDSLFLDPKKMIVAIVIKERHCSGHRGIPDCTYKYIFCVNGKKYKGICPDESYTVGQWIAVDYVIKNPNYNVKHGLYGSYNLKH